VLGHAGTLERAWNRDWTRIRHV